MALVERIVIRATANGPGIELQTAKVAPGGGIEGDRYANGTGSFYKPGKPGQDVTLIEAEALAGRRPDRGGLRAQRGDPRHRPQRPRRQALSHRRRRAARGRALPPLPARCATAPGVLRELVGRGGLCADVLVAGEFGPGDEIEVL